MHYKNGTPAKPGDIIMAKTYNGVPYSAVVVATSPGSTACNLSIVLFHPTAFLTATASECLLASDAFPADPKPAA